MRQSGVTVIAPIKAGSTRDAVAERLLGLGDRVADDTATDILSVRKAKFVHFLSFFAFGDSPSFVVLEINADGSSREICRRFAEIAPGFLREVFDECVDPNERLGPREWLRFLRRHDAALGVFYLANPGRSVKQIHAQAELRARVSELLKPERREVDATSLWESVQKTAAVPIEHAGAPELSPFRVRWGLHSKGARRQLRALRGWLQRSVLPLVGAAGLASAAIALYSMPVWQSASIALSLAFVLGLGIQVIWLRERPVHASKPAWSPFARAWFKTSVTVAALLGLIPLASSVAHLPLVHVAAYGTFALTVGIAAVGFITIAAATTLVALAAGSVASTLFALAAAPAWTYAIHCYWLSPFTLGLIWAGSTGLTVLLAGIYATTLLALVRKAELNDQEDPIAFDLETLRDKTAREDKYLQNHLATVTELRDGRIRLYALRVVLRAIALLARVYFNQGDLHGIASIHFGRFLIHSHEGKHNLLFLGNYDGGFSAYLGAFSTVSGTTAVWSNTMGFPRTFGLLADGAQDEQRFKAFGRKSQVVTLGWMSAYRTLSTGDVRAGAQTHLDLTRTPAKQGASRWVLLLKAFATGRRAAIAAEIQGPFDEAACDAAVRRV